MRFLSVVEYPEWLANVILVPKKDDKDGFSRYNHILMAIEDMEKTPFITEAYHLVALERFFERIRQFRLRLNPKKCTFELTFGKLLGCMVSERDIEVDPNKIRTILDMIALRTQKKIRGFLRMISDNAHFERIREYLSLLVLVLPSPGRLLLLYLLVSNIALGCMLVQLDDLGNEQATQRLRHYMTKYSVHLISRLYLLRYLFDKPTLIGQLMRWLVLLAKFDIHYVTQKSIRWSVVVDYLASLPVSNGRAINDDFPYKDIVVVTSFLGWRMYFDGTTNHSRYEIGLYLGLKTTFELKIRQMEVFGEFNLALRQIQGEQKTRDVELRPYHAYLELLVRIFDDLRYTHLPRVQNHFADALAILASMIDIPANTIVQSRSVPTYCCLIDEVELDDGLPWYHDIYQFLRFDTYPEVTTTKDKRALRQLAT
ncbi:hypothetical protein CK203_034327 [Vitis vinifera]|uniref:RNase H type-1 domain-containing protein n=1 Tax=Vitis vinifera TaxID=29760 RepID=A0A438INH6_VITVI|nr:hypothetical protein CK203_034327 [Vitis vinifera]